MEPRAAFDQAIGRAAVSLAAASGQRLVGLVVAATRDVTLPPTPSVDHPQRLGERLEDGVALTAIADPEVGPERLGGQGARAGSVKDLLAARAADGRRVADDLERLCATEAARAAPTLAVELGRDHPELLADWATPHPGTDGDGPSTGRPSAPGSDAASLLQSEVAARLALALASLVGEQLGDVPLGPSAPELRT